VSSHTEKTRLSFVLPLAPINPEREKRLRIGEVVNGLKTVCVAGKNFLSIPVAIKLIALCPAPNLLHPRAEKIVICGKAEKLILPVNIAERRIKFSRIALANLNIAPKNVLIKFAKTAWNLFAINVEKIIVGRNLRGTETHLIFALINVITNIILVKIILLGLVAYLLNHIRQHLTHHSNDLFVSEITTLARFAKDMEIASITSIM
jgi:hypothetical protein